MVQKTLKKETKFKAKKVIAMQQKIRQKTNQIEAQKEALTRRILVFAILMIFEGCP